MKKILFIASMLFSSAMTQAADWYVNQSGAPGTFTTIQGAILVAAANDRVFVSPYDLYTENLSITKNITIAPATPGMTVQVNGTVTVTGFPNRNVHIIGMKSASFTAATGTATATGKTIFNLTECEGPVTAEENVELRMYYCKGGYNVAMKDGRLYGNSIGYLTVTDEAGSNSGDTITVVSNKMVRLDWTSDNHYFFIANNFVGGQTNQDGTLMEWGILTFNSMVYNLGYQNNILNNTVHVSDWGCIRFANGYNLSNVKIYNNVLSISYDRTNDCNLYWINCGAVVGGAATGSPDIKHNIFASPGAYCDCCDRLSGPGITNVSYEPTANAVNYIVTNFSRNTVSPHFPSNVFDPVTGELNSGSNSVVTSFVNRGHASIQFQDIDMTRNDPGTYGGPYSWDNYNNIGAGKARVYDLNMPFEIWPGQTPTIKAGAVHTK
jgi:hypothetical protein